MSEVPRPETVSQATHLFDALTSPDNVQAEHQDAVEAVKRLSPSLVAQRETELMAAYQDAVHNQPENNAHLKQLREEMHTLDYMGSKYFSRAGLRSYEMERHPEQLWLDIVDTEKVEPVEQLISGSPRLQSQQFVGSVPDISGWPTVVLDGDREHTVAIPCANMIHAESFSSWEAGRAGQKMPDHGATTSSKAVIDDYAARNSEFPPIEAVGYIQPNGAIVYSVRDGAHRAAAAIKRGDQSIASQQLRLVRLEYNLVDTPLISEGSADTEPEQ